MRTQTTLNPNRPLNLLSGVLSAAAVIVLIAPVAFAGSLHYPNLQLFVLQLLSTVALLGGGFFAAVAAAGGFTKEAIEAGNTLESPPACANAPIARRLPARAASPAVPTPAHATPA